MTLSTSVIDTDSIVMNQLRDRMNFSPSPAPLEAIDFAKEPMPLKSRRFHRAKEAAASAFAKDPIVALTSIKADQQLQAEKSIRIEEPAENDQIEIESENGRLTRSRKASMNKGVLRPSTTTSSNAAALGKPAKAKFSKKAKSLIDQKSSKIQDSKFATAHTLPSPEINKKMDKPITKASPTEKTSRDEEAVTTKKVIARIVESTIDKPNSDAAVSAKAEKLQAATTIENVDVTSVVLDITPLKNEPALKKDIVKSKKQSKVPWANSKSLSAASETGKKAKDASRNIILKPAKSPAEKDDILVQDKEVGDEVVQQRIESEELKGAKKCQIPTEQSINETQMTFSFFDNSVAKSLPSSPDKFAAQARIEAAQQQYQFLIDNDDDDDEFGYIKPSQQSTPHGKKQMEKKVEIVDIKSLDPVSTFRRYSSQSNKTRAHTASIPINSGELKKLQMQSIPLKAAAKRNAARKEIRSAPRKIVVTEIEDGSASNEDPAQILAQKVSDRVELDDNVVDASAQTSERIKNKVNSRIESIAASNDLPESNNKISATNEGVPQTQPAHLKPLPDINDLFGFALAEQSVKELRKEKGAPLQKTTQSRLVEDESQTQEEGQFSMMPSSGIVNDVPVNRFDRDESLPPLEFGKLSSIESIEAPKAIASSGIKKSKKDKDVGNKSSSDLSDYNSDLNLPSWGSKPMKKVSADMREMKIIEEHQKHPMTIQDVLRYSMLGEADINAIDATSASNKGKGKGKRGSASVQKGGQLLMKDSVDSSFHVEPPVKGKSLLVSSTPITSIAKAQSNKKVNQAMKKVVTAEANDDYDVPPGMAGPAKKKGRVANSGTTKAKLTSASNTISSTNSKQNLTIAAKALPAGTTPKSIPKSSIARPKARPLTSRDVNRNGKDVNENFNWNELPGNENSLQLSKKRVMSMTSNEIETQPIIKAGSSKSKRARLNSKINLDDDDEAEVSAVYCRV